MFQSLKSFGLSIARNIGPGIGIALGSAITIGVIDKVLSTGGSVSAKLKEQRDAKRVVAKDKGSHAEVRTTA